MNYNGWDVSGTEALDILSDQVGNRFSWETAFGPLDDGKIVSVDYDDYSVRVQGFEGGIPLGPTEDIDIDDIGTVTPL